ncbi:MAG TPA: HD domain-containing protein [Candidatus Binatia bacterium]|jgi:HD superfamily phosphohydrolase|nr:HD domain-containing protein [Candidatus Binatia bacterium]
MHYQDAVYGTATIDEPVLLALMETAAVTRLQGVMQHGISALVGITSPITRFEHSVGAMLLVRQLGADIEEQIAALLHDVSHTAFSHVIDYVFEGHDSQDFHEEAKEAYMKQTELPDLLAAFGFDWRHFIKEDYFPLLEQPAPHLCADRLDYFLRDGLGLGLATRAEAADVLQHLVVEQNRIVCDDLSTARWLAYTFIAADKASWANFREVGLYELTARAIRRALQGGHLQERDFWGTDQALWQMLQEAEDTAVQEMLALVSEQTGFTWDEDNPTFWVSTKLRSIDPDVRSGSSNVAPLSQLDHEFAIYREAYHSERQGAWPMRVIPPV